MGSKDRNVERMEQQLADWGAKIETLMIKAETAGEHLQADYRRHAKDLRTQWVDAQARLADFKAAGSLTWDAFRTGIEGAWGDLEAALHEIKHEAAPAKPPRKPAVAPTAPTRANYGRAVPKAPIRHRGNNR